MSVDSPAKENVGVVSPIEHNDTTSPTDNLPSNTASCGDSTKSVVAVGQSMKNGMYSCIQRLVYVM